MDAFQEFYHAPILHAKQSPIAARPEVQAAGFEGLHYEIEGPHRMVTTYGGRGWEMPPEMLKPMETRDAQRTVRTVGRARSRHRRVAEGRQPRGQEAVGTRLVPDLAELRDPDLGTRLVPHVPLLADVVQHARVRGHALLRAGEDRARAPRAGDGRGHVQGVRAARREHARGDATHARVARRHGVPAERPGDPVPPPAQGGRRLGRRLPARDGGGEPDG